MISSMENKDKNFDRFNKVLPSNPLNIIHSKGSSTKKDVMRTPTQISNQG